jgi:uncharacterized membrane protein
MDLVAMVEVVDLVAIAAAGAVDYSSKPKVKLEAGTNLVVPGLAFVVVVVVVVFVAADALVLVVALA